MLHPHVELRRARDDIGYGVFATARLPKGTITWVMDPFDQVFDGRWAEEVDEPMRKVIERYTWANARGERILCWDFARFINHSCDANVLGPGGIEIDVAIRDIDAGEEITCDYGTLNLERPMRCLCGSAECRGAVKPEDLDALAPQWDEAIRAAFAHVLDVEQPLWAWLGTRERTIRGWAARPETIESVIAHRNGAATRRSSRRAL